MKDVEDFTHIIDILNKYNVSNEDTEYILDYILKEDDKYLTLLKQFFKLREKLAFSSNILEHITNNQSLTKSENDFLNSLKGGSHGKK